MVKHATKDEAEKEDEEAERLVRKSPKKKPPRRDKERGRLEVEDDDLDDEDDDMSMNYKDIGGSVSLAARVAYRYLSAAEKQLTHSELLEQEVVNPETEEKVKLKSLKDKPKNSPARKVYEEHLKKWEDTAETEDEPKQPESKPKPKPKPKKPKPEPKEDPDALSVEDLDEMDSDMLYDVAISDEHKDDEVGQAARDKLLSQKKPLPKGFPEVSEFKGQLRPEDLSKLDDHFEKWTALDYYQNIKELTKNRIQAHLEGNERDEAYFEQIIDHYKEKEDQIPKSSLREDTAESMLGSDLDGPFENEKELSKKRKDWYQSAMFSPLNAVQERLSEVEDMGDFPEGSKGEAYKKELHEILSEVREKKAFDRAFASDNFLLNLQESGADYDPGDVDFTDPDDRRDFMSKIRTLPDEDLADLVKGNEEYAVKLGVDGLDSENPSIPDDKRQEFFDELEEDLRLKGFFEQVRVRGPGQKQVFDKASLLKFREKLRNQTDPTLRYTGFTDFLLDFIKDSLEEAEKRLSNVRIAVSAKAFQRGFRSALRKAGVAFKRKEAQYRGLPGPLSDDDTYKPPQTDWHLPTSEQALYVDDYIDIVTGARKWLQESYINHVLDEYDFDMACRLALDMSIHTTNDFKYNGGVRHPEYDRLLEALKKVEQGEVNVEGPESE